MAGYIYAGGWKTLQKGFIYANGAWRTVQKGFVYVSGSWRQFFSSALLPTIATQVTISKSGSVLITLTGTNYRWTNYSSGVYYFERSTNNLTWTQMDTGSITNPSSGGSNTKTYVLTQSDVTANTTNYYRFRVAVTSVTGNSGTSTSSNTTVEGPRDISNLSSSAITTTSVTLSWTASLYAGSQVVQYKASSSGTWLTSSTQSGVATSASVGSLTTGTSYDFRILPWTGSSGNGYYGNYSNTYTVSTTVSKKPNNPTGLTASSITTNSLTFSWTAPTTDSSHNAADDYIWTYNTSGIEPTGGNLTSSTSVSITSLSSSTTYYLWVIARNADGNSSWVYTTATTLTAIITPGVPGSLGHTKSYSYVQLDNFLTRITSTQKNQQWTYQVNVNYNITWTAATNASYYEVAASNANSNPGTAYATSISATNYTFSSTQINQNTITWYFWVRAVSSDGTTGAWTSGSTGGASTATVVVGWTLRLWRCDSSASTAGSATNTSLSNLWTGVNASFTHYANIQGTVAGYFVNVNSVGCV
jgi:hypothetical protein